MRKWLIILIVAVVVAGAAVVLIRVSALPRYLHHYAIGALEEHFGSNVKFAKFSVRFFPGIRITGEDLALQLKNRKGIPPFIKIHKFSARAGFLDLLRKPHHVRHVELDGMQLIVPPRNPNPQPKEPHKKKKYPIVVDEIVVNNTELDMLTDNPKKHPRVFLIHHLTIHNAGLGEAMSFSAGLTNPTPTGEIQTHGTLGPWDRDDPGLTPLSATYTFSHADLGTFHGLAGILTSEGKFGGVLNRIDVYGETKTPGFELTSAGHRVPLETQFHAVVNGGNGNTLLDPVRAKLVSSLINAKGGVFQVTGVHGRVVILHATAAGAKLQDLLRVAVKSSQPPMKGLIDFQSQIKISPGKGDILDRLALDGDFHIHDASFSKLDVQKKVDALSHRGRGHPGTKNKKDVISRFSGRFKMKNGVMTFPKLSFSVTGASVRLSGNYNMHNEKLDFHGALRLEAAISQTVKGWKSYLLKPLDPLFRKNGAGTVLPIHVTGTESHPSFGIDVGRVLTGKD
ncbi:MAG TPA: hypothetical protein VFZ08_12510 [Terriglobia bacterium]|nr:hypothetical protein [Terriglobia bacterium]